MGHALQSIPSNTLLGVIKECIDEPFCIKEKSCNPKIKKKLWALCPNLGLSLIGKCYHGGTLVSFCIFPVIQACLIEPTPNILGEKMLSIHPSICPKPMMIVA